MRNILLVNDDGIHSPGLARLAAAAVKFGRVWVAAPSGQCSGMSHKLTIFDPVAVERVDYPVPVEAAYSIGGTPADCVKIAVTALLPVKPDVVFSGINRGFNTGYDIAYSGTIGAAMEALLNDVPAIAFSQDMSDDARVAEAYLEQTMAQLLDKEPSLTHVWNVNFPGGAAEDCRGIAWDVSIANVDLYENYYVSVTLDGGELAMKPEANVVSRERTPEGSDLRAVLDGYVAVGRVKCLVK